MQCLQEDMLSGPVACFFYHSLDLVIPAEIGACQIGKSGFASPALSEGQLQRFPGRGEFDPHEVSLQEDRSATVFLRRCFTQQHQILSAEGNLVSALCVRPAIFRLRHVKDCGGINARVENVGNSPERVFRRYALGTTRRKRYRQDQPSR
jgi:hypothetical protein